MGYGTFCDHQARFLKGIPACVSGIGITSLDCVYECLWWKFVRGNHFLCGFHTRSVSDLCLEHYIKKWGMAIVSDLIKTILDRIDGRLGTWAHELLRILSGIFERKSLIFNRSQTIVDLSTSFKKSDVFISLRFGGTTSQVFSEFFLMCNDDLGCCYC